MQKHFTKWLSHRYLPLVLALLAMALALPSLWAGLLADDFTQRNILQGTPFAAKFFGSPLAMFDFVDGNPERTRKLMDIGFMPWWSLENVRVTFWRPVTALTHWLDYRLWPDHFPLMHLHSLVWFGMLVFVITLLYRRFMGVGWVSGLAALLYTIDDAHAIPVCWLANRNGLLAAFFGLLALLAHDRWRHDGYRAAAFLAPLYLLMGILSNEGAVATCAYLLAYAVFLDRGRGLVRVLSLASYGVVIVVWRLVYSSMGYGVWGSAAYIDPLHSPLQFLNALWSRGPILLLGQWALPPSDFSFLYPPTVHFVVWVGALVFLIGIFTVLIPLLRKDRLARFWCLGMLLALIPSSTILPGDRLLFLVGVGSMGILAQFISTIRTGSVPLPTLFAWRALARILYFVFIVVHLVLAPLFLPLRIHIFTTLCNKITTCIESAPLDDSVADRTVILVNTPNFFFVSLLVPVRTLKGHPIPAYLHSLAPNMGMFPVPILMTRTDEHTLFVKPQGGFPWLLMRDNNHPFAVGEKVKLTGMSVEVTKLTKEGWPLEVAYRFDVPLEDPSLLWLDFKDDAYVPFTPPAVGEFIVLNQ
jgi:hypothetical protein